jgi:hypothetical protein
MVRGRRKARKIKELPLGKKDTNQKARGYAAQKTAHETYDQCRRPKGGAVKKKLGIEKNGAHHKGRKPIFFHTLPGKGGRDGDSAVHTERGRYTDKGSGNNPKGAQFFPLHNGEHTVDLFFAKN